jgi:hypothetical protein
MTTVERNTLIESALDLVPWQASRFNRLPAGITIEDLESTGQEALIHAAVTWDPELDVPWRSYARMYVKNAMRNVIAKARSRRQLPLEIQAEDGTLMPRPDTRAADPAELAAARERFMGPMGRRRRQHVGLSDPGPEPAAIAARAAELREAMFGAIAAADVSAIVKTVTDKAKAGDLKAARLLFDLLSPSRSGATIVHQKAVVIHQGDLES